MIELNHLQKVVGQSVVLDIETLLVSAGDIAAIVGAGDSGTLELLALLIGQSKPTSGTIRLVGLDPVRDREKLSHRVGVLFQDNGLYERLSARDNLVFYCQLRGIPTARADEVLEQVGLIDRSGESPGRLPQGLNRRLSFGRAILHNPSILLLVDPFRGCDEASCTLLSRLIRQIGDTGTCVLSLATGATGLTQLCQTVYMLEHGHLVKMSTWQDENRVDIPFKVPARQEGQVVLINPADILYVSTEGSQTCLHTPQGKIFSHLTIGELEKRLSHNGFFRAHRSYLVNLQRAKAIVPYTRDSFSLILDDPMKTEIPLSKTSAHELRDLLGY